MRNQEAAMLNIKAVPTPDLDRLSDTELIALARQRHPRALRFIVQRYNRRLFRVARSVLRDDGDAEDVVQETYLRAFGALDGFRGDSSLSTWLTRIALNEALGRLRKRRPTTDLIALDAPEERDRMQVIPFPLMKPDADPEQTAARQQIRRVLERAIDDLPDPFRVVFVMRDVEEMSVEETAAQLGLRPATVKTRLHRARARLRDAVKAQLESTLTDTFPFDGARCARIADTVLQRLGIAEPPHPQQEEKP
jgi:RNA polymerase sigma-70 factor (ECF subfamily)